MDAKSSMLSAITEMHEKKWTAMEDNHWSLLATTQQEHEAAVATHRLARQGAGAARDGHERELKNAELQREEDKDGTARR